MKTDKSRTVASEVSYLPSAGCQTNDLLQWEWCHLCIDAQCSADSMYLFHEFRESFFTHDFSDDFESYGRSDDAHLHSSRKWMCINRIIKQQKVSNCHFQTRIHYCSLQNDFKKLIRGSKFKIIHQVGMNHSTICSHLKFKKNWDLSGTFSSRKEMFDVISCYCCTGWGGAMMVPQKPGSSAAVAGGFIKQSNEKHESHSSTR